MKYLLIRTSYTNLRICVSVFWRGFDAEKEVAINSENISLHNALVRMELLVKDIMSVTI